jgi:hypothetical protein
MTAREIREWLDRRQETGAVRMGLVLGCGVCPWVDFYRIDEFGTRFTCKRCGSENVVTQERWRLPESSPRWYYDLHPTVREFLDQSGDVPVLGVSRFSGRGRALDVEFELEIVKPGEIKPRMEIDFAFMTRDGLVLGEAKRSGRLDGQTAKDRVRDARKLIDAAEILAAREICFASTKTWDNAARAAIHRVVEMSSTRVTVSLLERLTASV